MQGPEAVRMGMLPAPGNGALWDWRPGSGELLGPRGLELRGASPLLNGWLYPLQRGR